MSPLVMGPSGPVAAYLRLSPNGTPDAIVEAFSDNLGHVSLRLFPGLAGVPVMRAYGGFRPFVADHLPVIGADHRLPGLWHATGHEGAGIVEEVGAAVTHLRPGDRVVMSWRVPCGACGPCGRGDRTHCASPLSAGPRMRLAGSNRYVKPVLSTGTFTNAGSAVAAARSANAIFITSARRWSVSAEPKPSARRS